MVGVLTIYSCRGSGEWWTGGGEGIKIRERREVRKEYLAVFRVGGGKRERERL